MKSAPVLAISLAKKKGPSDEEPPSSSREPKAEDEAEEGEGASEEYAGKLAELLGVPEEKRSEFAELLHSFVYACEE